jgi:hypothetical protein
MNPNDKPQKNDQNATNNEQRGANAGERKRDEEREGGPRYGGEAWEVADERGDNRFGHARNDDAEPSELVKTDPDIAEADENVESGGEQAGFGRGEKPRKPKARSTKNG